jgi:insulysin
MKTMKLLLALCLVLGAAFSAPDARAATPQALAAVPPRERAPNDASEYRRFVLPNGIKVLLLSDPKLNKSSVALVVGVGALADPPNRQGMAHFLEHMVFLGTQKYPNVSDFDTYLSTNGGLNNAYTARDRTNYHLEIRHEAFEGALDRFAQFFIAPLFTPEFTEREMNSIESEHQKNLENDLWREYGLRSVLVREGHPARQFGTGNRATLAGTTREELLAWYQAHYSANRMMLALTGAASLDQLERWARQYFEAVPDRQLPALRYPADYMPPRAALRELRMEPIKDLRHLTLSFPLPDLRAHVLSKPAEQLAFVLGHEGRGSLLSALKAEGLATGLGVWAEPETPDYGSFDMQISLTPDGLAKSARVLELVFATIERIRREGLPPHLFQERQAMARLDERYRDKGEGMGRAANLANALMDYPIDIAERVPFLWVQPDSKAVAAVLAHLRPDNLLVMRVAKGVPTDRVAPHYGTRYSLSEDGGAAYAALLKPAATAAITPPAPNPFIAERTALLPLQPVRLIDEPALSLYHLQDTEFQRPLVAHLLRWRLPRDRASLQTAVLMRFYEAAVREALTETTYTAAEAGLQFGLSAGLDGVQLVVEGYDASVGRLLDAVAPALVDLRLSEARFGALKERLLRELAAFELGDAYETLRESRLRTAREFHWRPDEQLPLARTVTLAQVQAFARSLYARGRLEALSHGNIAAPEAAAAVRRVAALLKTKPVAPTRLLKRRLLAGTPGEALRASETLKVNNSAYRAEYLIGRDSPELRAATAVLAAFIAEPFYTELRTKQQLGYIVAGGAAEDSGRLLATFLVQSADHPADEVERRVRALIAGLPRQLAELDEAGWKTLVDGVRDGLLEKDKSIAERASRLFRLAYEQKADWGRRAATLAALDGLTRDRAAALLGTALAPQTAQSLSFLGFGRDHRPASPSAVSFSDAQAWKKGRRFE